MLRTDVRILAQRTLSDNVIVDRADRGDVALRIDGYVEDPPQGPRLVMPTI
jgi:hypothetical protein